MYNNNNNIFGDIDNAIDILKLLGVRDARLDDLQNRAKNAKVLQDFTMYNQIRSNNIIALGSYNPFLINNAIDMTLNRYGEDFRRLFGDQFFIYDNTSFIGIASFLNKLNANLYRCVLLECQDDKEQEALMKSLMGVTNNGNR